MSESVFEVQPRSQPLITFGGADARVREIRPIFPASFVRGGQGSGGSKGGGHGAIPPNHQRFFFLKYAF